ncbi:MAG: hypothetical protein ACI8PZ_006911, partial [Myxococcota bacterium]
MINATASIPTPHDGPSIVDALVEALFNPAPIRGARVRRLPAASPPPPRRLPAASPPPPR